MHTYFSHLKKMLRDQKFNLAILTVFCFSFEWLFAWLFSEAGISEMLESLMRLLPPAFMAFLGLQGWSSQFATQMLAFGYIHPLILISLAFLQIGIPARYISGEIELRTFDILLTKPVKRFVIPVSVFSFLVIAAGMQFAAMFLGTITGKFHFDLQIHLKDYATAAFVGFIFFLSMGSISTAISTFQTEKAKALTKAMGLFVFLFFGDTIFKLSKSLQGYLSYSYFQLYQPGKIVLNQSHTAICILISIIIICLFFCVALVQFSRRDF